jgi:tetratricopeptide (TPR) repeat protein
VGGLRYLEAAQPEKAQLQFERAVQADETLGSAHNNLGLVHFEQGKLYPAALAFERAIQLLPEHPAPKNNLGLVLETTGKDLEALELYAEAHELAPTNPVYLGNLVRVRMKLGEADDSVRLQLQQMLLLDTRQEWLDWAEQQLKLDLNMELDRGPPPPNLNATVTPGASAEPPLATDETREPAEAIDEESWPAPPGPYVPESSPPSLPHWPATDGPPAAPPALEDVQPPGRASLSTPLSE